MTTTLRAVSHVHTASEQRVLELLGVRITILADSQETRGAFTLLDYIAPPRFVGPHLHWHRNMTELFYVLEGELTVTLNGQAQVLRPGDLALVMPGDEHSFTNALDMPTRFIVQMSPGGMEGYFTRLMAMVEEEGLWPLKDMSRVVALAQEYDTYSL